MSTQKTTGFTIVEVVLFLAITSVLIVTLLGGWTALINTQRYKDTVDTTYSFLQDQYNLTYNVERGITDTLRCDATGTVNTVDVVNAEPRGKSNCLVMGRYVRLTDGVEFKSYPIIGVEPGIDTSGLPDTEEIRSYNPKPVSQPIGLTQSQLLVPWSAEAMGSGLQRNTLQNIAFIIIRSPSSQSIRTYIVSASSVDPQIDVSADIQTANEVEKKLCLKSGSIMQGTRQSVVIRKYASSQNSIETIGDDPTCN